MAADWPSELQPLRNEAQLAWPRPRGDSPRSVLGPARSCLNLSSREASLSLKAELLRVLDSGTPPSATVAECGRDWDLCRGPASLALPAEGGGENRGEAQIGRAHV